MVRLNANAQQQLEAIQARVNEIATRVIRDEAIRLQEEQIGSGRKYPQLPNRSSDASGTEYPVKQSGDLVGDIDHRPGEGTNWQFGYFNTNLGKALTLLLGSDTVAPRANIPDVIVATETQRQIREEIERL